MRRAGWISVGLVLVIGLVVWLRAARTDDGEGLDSTRAPSAASSPALRGATRVAETPAADAPEAPVPPAEVDAPGQASGFHLLVRVRNPDGTAPPACEVCLRRKGVPGRERGKPQHTLRPFLQYELDRETTRANGGISEPMPAVLEARIELADPAAWWLCVVPPTRSHRPPAFLDGARLVSGEVADVVLPASRALEVEVVDADGRPVENAQIGMAPLRADRITGHAWPGEPTMGGWSLPMGEGTHRRTWHLPERGPLRVSARKRGYARAFARAGAMEDRVLLRLTKPQSLVRVVLENAESWPGSTAWLLVEDERYGPELPQIARATFANGEARFENLAGPGTYRVRVSSWDAKRVEVGGVALTAERPETTVRIRLERNPAFGRVVFTWARTSAALPHCWVRRPGKSWERWFLMFVTPDGMELRMLPAASVDVVLVRPDGSAMAPALGLTLRGGEDVTVPAVFEPIREFALPASAPELGPLADAWIEDSRGRRLPLLVHAVADAGAPPLLLDVARGAKPRPGARFQVPSSTAVLHWVAKDETTGSVTLVELRD